MKMYNANGKIVARMAATNINDGSFELFDNSGKKMAYLTTDVNGNGTVITYNNLNKIMGRLP
jgi:antitoxin component YwqK of YwqJK toxin-antitoxin module